MSGVSHAAKGTWKVGVNSGKVTTVGEVAEAGGVSKPGVGSGTLTGVQTKLPSKASADNIRGLTRENESAKILSQNGYHVEQNPVTSGLKNPDYKINGEIFDNYTPTTGNARGIWRGVKDKVDKGQTTSVVINMSDSPVSMEALRTQFNNYPMTGLDKVIVIDKTGTIFKLK